jgi:hypothetical protein
MILRGQDKVCIMDVRDTAKDTQNAANSICHWFPRTLDITWHRQGLTKTP